MTEDRIKQAGERLAEEYSEKAFLGNKEVAKDKAAYGKAYGTLMFYEAEDYVEQAYLAGFQKGVEIGWMQGNLDFFRAMQAECKALRQWRFESQWKSKADEAEAQLNKLIDGNSL